MSNSIVIKKKNISYEIKYQKYKEQGIETFEIDAQKEEKNDYPIYIYLMDNKREKKERRILQSHRRKLQSHRRRRKIQSRKRKQLSNNKKDRSSENRNTR